MVWYGMAWHGMAWHGMARRGTVRYGSSRKMRVLGQFTMYMVEFIQLYSIKYKPTIRVVGIPSSSVIFRHFPCPNHVYGSDISLNYEMIRNEPCVVRISGTF